MKKLYLMLLCTCLLQNSHAQSVTRLLACSPYDDVLRILDTNTYAQLLTRTLTISVGTVDGITGLARKISTGEYYTVVRSNSTRYLGVLNPITGSITSVGDLQDNFSQITFNGNNTLLGITGTGASNPSAVYRISTVDASKSYINTLYADYGQVICYNPITNKVYQWTGGYPYTYIDYDTTFVNSNNITPVNSTYEVTGAVYKTNGKFMTYDLDNNFLRTDTIGNNDQDTYFPTQVLKGLAYITCSRTITASSTTVCANGVVTLTMSGAADAGYQWYKNNILVPGATSQTLSSIGGGYFKCMITDGCGEDSLAQGKSINTLPTPVVNVTGSNTLCTGGSIQLLGSSGGSSQWYQNGILIQGATTNSLTVTTAGIYNMIKTNLNGCGDSASVGKTITVVAGPAINITGASTLCAGQSATLMASGANSYSWTNGPATASYVVAPAATTVYSVVGTSAAQCNGTGTLALNVTPLPPVIITPSSYTICSGESATLTATGATNYSWDFGPNTAGTVVSPTVATSYTVTGTDNNCSKTASITLAVDICTGLDYLASKTPEVILYPNPSSGYLIVESTETVRTIEVIDLNGKIIISKQVENGFTHRLNLSELSNSVYLIRISHASGNVVHSRLALTK